ncbi:DNA repair protein RecO [Novosphingobium aerophilum]|uniref:DNA repair protein RecO n=1 Tax=Novosphingobium TaxID=165696 RepID=UPI0006C8D6A5|nr:MULTISPECIES: recombination protein O N-terminal domain-containing protein [unclassified Novosphingobium]KPH59525.1 DNA recombination protein RecO [Novosphingobium sp. ST904]TCM37955.1 DNA replication and repair protein RecO [Novosphingobium sp. ST904]WRT92236.1 recombination protein O N-terminal domain-containing protein [Novosphingobium sp. RL4]
MQLRASAIVCASRPHGETAAIVRLLTAEAGLVAAYVAGGRGRELRPVLIPGNGVEAEIRSKSDSQLPFARIELVSSRGPWLGEPLPAAAIAWVTALTATCLPERHPYPALYQALGALLEAICVAPSARGWALPLLSYEVLLLRELGYGVPVARPEDDDWGAILTTFDLLGRELARYPLADRRGDAMGARVLLRERLGRIHG